MGEVDDHSETEEGVFIRFLKAVTTPATELTLIIPTLSPLRPAGFDPPPEGKLKNSVVAFRQVGGWVWVTPTLREVYHPTKDEPLIISTFVSVIIAGLQQASTRKEKNDRPRNCSKQRCRSDGL